MAVRKRATSMTAAERNRFRSVITNLNQSGTFGSIVAHHADMMHNMHWQMGDVGLNRFLPWHRVFLLRLEEAGQQIHPLFFIPYWRWTTQRQIPPWLADFTPTVNVPGAGQIAVTRNVGWPPPLPTPAVIDDVLDEETFRDFVTGLAFAHDNVHGWVGGTMASIPTAPADPIFWLHHAQVDRIWSIWQAAPANAGKAPTLAGADRTMDPWPETLNQVLDIGTLGYSYQPTSRP